MKASAKLIILFSLLLMNHMGVFANPPKGPPYTTNICVRLTPNDSYYEILLRKLYLPEYRVNCQISNVNCDWLVVSNLSTNVEGDLYDVYSVSVPEDHKHDPDARYIITTTEIGIRENDGDYGEFDPHQNTQFTNIPGDRTVHWIIQWDLAPGNTFDVNDIPTINVGIPDNGAKQYILYGERDNDGVSLVDIDYLRFTPTEINGYIYASFPHPEPQSKLVVSLMQFNGNDQLETINASTNNASNSNFERVITFDNLDTAKAAYVKISFIYATCRNNVEYKLAIFNCTEVKETEDWLANGTEIGCPQSLRPVYVSFKNLKDVMCVETTSSNTFTVDYYDEDFKKINSNKTEEINSRYDDANVVRHRISNLRINENTIAKITFDQIPTDGCNIKLSRIKPVVLIHGIDACPRTPNGRSFFGDLINDNPYYGLRPYECHDFPWDSMISIKKTYVGKNVLSNFIESVREIDSLKVTIVAHSAGCVMTYYECQEHNASFTNNVDNIVFAGPPLLGSYLADQSIVFAPIDYAIKRTSPENLNLIARGTEEIWERGHTPFLFNCQRVSVIIGLRKYITADEAGTSIVDSIDKYKDYDFFPEYHSLLSDLKNIASFNIDIWWDVIADSFEGIGELIVGLLARLHISFHSSELHRLNRSDSAVGTYSAYLNNNQCFQGINSKFTDQIHSQIQRFATDNEDFFNVIRDRLAIIDLEKK